MKIYTELEQGTEAWRKIRSMKMTASKAQCIATPASPKELKENPNAYGVGLKTYIYELITEKYSSATKESYTNEHIDRGNLLEADARTLYELTTGQKVKEVGFVEMNEYVGMSPDGIVDEKNLIEIKCPADVKHMKILLDGVGAIDSAYIWQMQMQMLVFGAEWCDFISYNPNFTKSMVVIRILPDTEKFEKLQKGFEKGIELMKELEAKYLSNQ